MLNELDKELTRRGHKFVRYADDCMILCQSRRASERVCESICAFIEFKRLHPKSVARMKARLKELTSRSNGWGYAKLKDWLNRFINGWMNYFRLTDMRNILQSTDEWLRHRICSYVWKCWKKVGTKFMNLMKCGIDRWRAWQWVNTRGGYWNTAGSPILCRAMSNGRLKHQGYPCLVDLYVRLHQN